MRLTVLCTEGVALSFLSRLFARTRPEPSLPSLTVGDLQAEWLIVGLGNPGAKYSSTRHNVGYMAVDDLLAANGDILTPVSGMKAHVAQLSIGDQKALAVRSTTFMNLSGEAIGPLAQALGIAPNRVVCIHDELDLPANTVRIKLGGNENGHNGLKSLSEHLGTRDYLRVRIGIARPPKGSSIPDYVLGPVDSGRDFDAAIARAAEAARLLVAEGLSKAQNRIHSA